MQPPVNDNLSNINKLEILPQFKKKYGSNINPNLISIKYCQTDSETLVEMSFLNIPFPTVINLDFISDDYENTSMYDNYVSPLFKPNADIVDNATTLLNLDPFSHLNCFDNLLNDKAIKVIDKKFNPIYYKS
jgi:hypothetical protein